MQTNYQRLVTSILNQRRKLISLKLSDKNTTRCHSYIQEISMQVEAYKMKWNDDGWKKFILRNIDKLEYLIPNNKSGKTIKTKLYEIK